MSVIRQIINGAKSKFTFFINSITATGGTKVFLNNKIYHIFTQPGTFEITSIPVYVSSNQVNYLISGAGGSSAGFVPGSYGSGGGGAGALRIGECEIQVATYPVTVGTGSVNSNGESSSIFSLTSNGGGRGSQGTTAQFYPGSTAPPSLYGSPGGSGGGAGSFGFFSPPGFLFAPSVVSPGGSANQPISRGFPGGDTFAGAPPGTVIPAAFPGGGGGGANPNNGYGGSASKGPTGQSPATGNALGGTGFSSPLFPYQIGQIANLPSDWITSILTYGFCKGGDSTGPFPTSAMIGTTNTGNGGQGNGVAGSPGIVIISYDVYNNYNGKKTL